MVYKYNYRKKNRTANIMVVAFAVLVALVFAVAAVLEYFSTEGFVEANVIRVSGDSIIIGNNCTAIIAETSTERAQSIQQGIDKVMSERPNTHDSFVQVMKSFNITLDAVKLNSYDGRYYYSDMILRSGSKVLALDVMPSDGIAIALRSGSPIYINSTLLMQIGKNIC